VKAKQFCQLVAATTWIFDFFAVGFDYLLQFPPQQPGGPDQEVILSLQKAEKARLTEAIEAADGEVPNAVYSYLGFPDRHAFLEPGAEAAVGADAFWPSLLAVLRAIDQSVETMSPYLYGLLPDRWKAVRSHFAAAGYRLDRDQGTVIFKPPAITQQGWFQHAEARGFTPLEQRGQYHHRFFQNLSRIHEHECAIEWVWPKAIDDFEALGSPLSVGMCPVVDTMEMDGAEVRLLPGALRIVLDPDKPNRFLVDDAACRKDELKKTIEDAVEQAVAAKVDLLLFPELTMPTFLVEHLQDYLRRVFLDDRPTPKLTLAGSWMKLTPEGRFNEAVLLNDRGSVLVRQRKMHRYAMQGYEQPKYGLQHFFGGRSIEESADITPRRMVFLESRGANLRLGVLICEDLCQPAPGVAAARNACASVILSPVMAGPLTAGGGFSVHALELTQDPGTLVCVSNSGALAGHRWELDGQSGQPPVGLVAAPLYGRGFPYISDLKLEKSGKLLIMRLQ
jgi:carbon-nitrogen hydrolase